MRIVFWGSPKFAIPTLEALNHSEHDLACVITQPDRKRSRGKHFDPTLIKARAEELGLTVETPKSAKNNLDLLNKLSALNADLYVVVAFGQILPPEIIKYPPLGCWNGHASILPRWRGAAPIQWTLIKGDKSTGVTIMSMEKGLDTGPVLIDKKIKIDLLDNYTVLSDKLSRITSKLVLDLLSSIDLISSQNKKLKIETLNLINQSDLPGEVSYARLIKKEDLRIDWNNSLIDVHRMIMGLHPHAYTNWQGKRIKILDTEPLLEEYQDQLSTEAIRLIYQISCKNYTNGEIVKVNDPSGLIVSCSEQPLLIRRAQLEGKKPLCGKSLVQQLGAKEGGKFDC